ncbi:hypothetical protein GCM10009133_15970 [Cocleimonas flava]|uniref:Uncharacterized protein n=1 Tax=Cocleimonas flava TaxID=634765 RepID=A0A4R1ESH8_9GAMM|nr:hypothetical protein [Cocleimonas flava]TCJ84527.1 hypothetical protein EV695_2484 [Cocleimonas flava]
MKFTKALPYLLLSWAILTPQAFAVEEKDVAKVQTVIEAFKSRNTGSIAKMVSYPLISKSNRPAINNEYEFVNRFDEVFDQNLLRSIVSSDARTDWNTVGWRGIMLFDGLVWLDHDGNILSVKQPSTFVNKGASTYNRAPANNRLGQSKPQLVAQATSSMQPSRSSTPRGRSSLHRSVSNYAQPVLEWKTSRYHVRVDDIGNGRLRYASWPVHAPTSVKPDIVLSDGRLEVDRTGRNHRYVFNNGNFSYHLKVNAQGHQTPGLLEVFKGEQRFLTDNVREIIRR